MKNKATPKKLFAMFLAATMVCTMLQCTFLTAFAEAATIDELIEAVNADGKVTQTEAVSVNTIVDLYNAMDATTQETYETSVTAIKNAFYTAMTTGYTTFNGVSDFSFDQYSQLTYVDGYVRYELNNAGGPGLRLGPRAMVPFDGLEIMFNRVHQFDTATSFGIGVQLTPATADIESSNILAPDFTVTSTKGALVFFDFMNGKVIYNLKKSSTDIRYVDFAVDEIKTENIRYKAFTLGFAKGDETNPLNVIIKIADGSDPIVLPIPADCYDESTISLDGNVNFAINRGCYTAENGTSSTPAVSVKIRLDIAGYRNTKIAAETVNTINTLDVNTITEADAKAIYNAVDNYSILTEFDKAQIDTTKLDKLKSKLIEIAKAGYTLPTGWSGNTTNGIIVNGSTMADDGYANVNFNAHTQPNLRIGPSTQVDFDGLELKFANFKNLGTVTSVMGFGLHFIKSAGGDITYRNNEGVLLYFDIANGNLILNKKDETGGDSTSGYNITITVENLVSSSDVIKSLPGKIFTLGIDKLANGNYQFVINTADGQTVTAETSLDESLFLSSGKTYFCFNRGYYHTGGTQIFTGTYLTTGSSSATKRNNSFDYFGYVNTKNIKAVEALIEKIPADVTTNDGNVIFEAEEAYAALTDAEKALVDNAKLTAVRTQYDALFTAETAEEGYTVITDSLLHYKLATINTWSWGTDFGTALDGNGIRVKWTNGGKANRISIGNTVNMDGLNIRFNNFKRISGTNADITILLSRDKGNEHKRSGLPHFAVVLDAVAGTLKVSTKWSDNDASNRTVYDIIEDDLLKYENIAGAKFTVGFEEVGEMEYKVTVNVAGQSVSGIIPAQAFADVSIVDDTTTTVNALYNPKNCNFAVAAWSGNTQTVDVVGFKSDATVTATKIAGATLTVSDSISVNYKVNSKLLDTNQYVNPEIKFEIAGSTITVVGEKEEGTGYYNFTYPDIAPHLMNETITATLYAYRAADLETPILMGDTKEYSIKEYCYNMLEKYKDDEELCDLIVDLLRYGAASQTYVDKDVENLVTADLTPEQNTFGTTYTAPADSVASKVALSGTPATKYVSWKAVALYLADVVNLRYRFELAENVDVNTLTVQATVNGEDVTVDAPKFERIGSTNTYYLYFDALTAANLRDTVAVTVCDAEGNAVSKTATYSVESYVKAQLAKSPEADYEAFLKALLCYGDSAKVYKN